MLTGRESLIRLVGKRRRFLPHRQSLLSTPIQGSLNLLKKNGNGGSDLAVGDGESKEDRGKTGIEVSGSEWVSCPVCGKKVRGEDYVINSHLDACLARGTKRKFSQRTLFQLNFCSRSKVKIHAIELDDASTTVSQSGPNNGSLCVTNRKSDDVRGFEAYTNNRCEVPLNSEVMQTYRIGSTENPVTDDRINYRVDLASLLPENEMSTYDIDKNVDDISGLFLETFIVGRRFGDEVELTTGASVLLLRDPDNVKDPNAVKVLSADCGCSKMLGFLPRELAQFLSPLMDKFCLTFEGSITSVPKHASAVVPIQIVCQDKLRCGERDCDNLHALERLWKHALCVAESAKNHPPSVPKYQQNFIVLIQEVLRSDPHLFTDDEKNFLGTFTSLLEDSQRLFVRLYSRKGPWFRRSNISYPEVLDCEQAIKDLSAAGYISSIESIKELQKNELKEVLNVLTVSELREILCMLNEKCSRGTRKQDFIGSLLSAYDKGLCPLLQSIVLKKTGACVQTSVMAESLIWRAERLFFLNGEQDLSAFLLVDLGIVKYPTYNCITLDHIFSGQSDLLSYEESIEVAQIMDDLLMKTTLSWH
ncbi:unnamed protein product [Ilex paraguariensis]|uniref:Fanconi-associated nuclease n=2 Tax=Ilex paraguariensis TaxID=185542 RepID=A0ABC8U2P2_9AQUA